MFFADLIPELFQFVAAEFDHLPGGDADQVIVRLPPRDHFVIALLIVEKNLLQDAGILQVAEGSVDGRAADLVSQSLQAVDELLGLEQPFLAEHRVEDHGALGRELQLLLMQVTAKDRAHGFVRERFPARFGRDLGQARKDVGASGHSIEV